jgi:transaldolase
MKLYLESNLHSEIAQAAETRLFSGLNARLNTLRRPGEALETLALELSGRFPSLHVEALGALAHEIVHEAHRLQHAGLEAQSTLFRFPVSFEAIKACRELEDSGLHCHLEFVGSQQQGWMAMEAGASLISIPLDGLQQQGMDYLRTAEACMNIASRYSYPTQVMLSGVQQSAQFREALSLGVDAVSAPLSLCIQAPESPWASNNARELLGQSRLNTLRVADVLRKVNPTVNLNEKILEAVVQMSRGGMGAVAIIDADGNIAGVFTDGDLRRQLERHGADVLQVQLSTLPLKTPASIEADAFLAEAASLFAERRIDNVLVTDKGRLVGMLDIQDLNTNKLW